MDFHHGGLHDIYISGGLDLTTPPKSVSLQVNVPERLKRQLAMDAAKEGITIRTIILRALADSGYAIEEEELRDKRKK